MICPNETRQDRWMQTELVSTLAKNATKPNPFEIILLQTTRKENNWKTEETERAVVTLETEWIKGSNPWCLWWWWWWWWFFSPSLAATWIMCVSMLEAQFICITLKPFFSVLLNIFKTSYSKRQELQTYSFHHQENHENHILLSGKSFPHNQTSFVIIT